MGLPRPSTEGLAMTRKKSPVMTLPFVFANMQYPRVPPNPPPRLPRFARNDMEKEARNDTTLLPLSVIARHSPSRHCEELCDDAISEGGDSRIVRNSAHRNDIKKRLAMTAPSVFETKQSPGMPHHRDCHVLLTKDSQ